MNEFSGIAKRAAALRNTWLPRGASASQEHLKCFTRTFHTLRKVSLTPGLQPGVRPRDRPRNCFNSLPSELDKPLKGLAAMPVPLHRAEVPVLMRYDSRGSEMRGLCAFFSAALLPEE